MLQITRAGSSRRAVLAAVSALVVGLLAAPAALAATYTWIGPDGGLWSDAANWSPAGPPNSSSADVVIPDGASLHLDADYQIRDLDLGVQATLNFDADADLIVSGSSFYNAGHFRQTDVSTSLNRVIVNAPQLHLTGPINSGIWWMSHDLSQILAGTPGNSIVFDDEMRGVGNVGGGTDLGIINRSSLLADGTITSLTIEPGSNANVEGFYDFVNRPTGKVRPLTEGSTVLLKSGQMLNEGRLGNHNLDANSRVEIEDAQLDNVGDGLMWWVTLRDGGEVRGGEWNGDGLVTAAFTEAVIGDLQMPPVLNDFGLLRYEGTLVFEPGDVARHYATLEIESPGVTWAGEGLVQVMTTVTNTNPLTTSVLTIESGMTVQGNDGAIGNDDRLGLHNFGTIESGQLGCGLAEFVINPGDAANLGVVTDVINEGTIRAQNQVDMIFRNQQFFNDGLVEALPGSNALFESTADVLNLNGATLNSGSWRVESTFTEVAAIDMPGTPVLTIGENAVVEFDGPFGEFRIGGTNLAATLYEIRGALRLNGDANHIMLNDLTNRGELRLGPASDILAFAPANELSLDAGGVFVSELNGTNGEEYGQISTSGTIYVDGDLRVELTPGYVPSPGDTFTLLESAAGIDGTFSSVTLPAEIYGTIHYNANDIVLEVDAQTTSIGDGPLAGAASQLRASPNPFGPQTTLRFAVNTPQRVTMAVHDVRGRVVRRVFEGPLAAGEHALRFDGRNDRGLPLPNGVYFARVTTSAGQAVRKITLLK